MSKPTQAVIKYSKKLWEKGVRKEIWEGDWYRHGGIDIVDLCVTPILVKKYIKHDGAFPIWTLCDECIEWLKEKGWRIYRCNHTMKSNDNSENSTPDKIVLVLLTFGTGEALSKDFVAPTLIEALLKAMLEIVAGNKEVQ